jgi:putative colanic acid biosynthesis acetyltransferase WcaF
MLPNLGAAVSTPNKSQSLLSSQTFGSDRPDATACPIDLSSPDNSELVRGAPLWFEALWYFLGLPLLRSHLITSSAFRYWLLRLFRAKVGKGVYIKPGLRVKFPWYLQVGDFAWLGEDLWIDNLAHVEIESHCCLSQGVYLCTGNHDWSSPNMRLFRRPIVCERGSWIGAKAILCPGVTIGAGAIVTAGTVVTKDVPPMEIHAGNPAQFTKKRILNS